MSYFVPGMTAVQLDTHTTAIRKVLEDARIKFIDRGKSGGPRGEVEGMTKRIVSNPSKPPFDRAAKKAQLEERATEGAKAISEYNAAREAERAKTERLRALRLAKEATDRTKKRR
jgi:hypothetical protein